MKASDAPSSSVARVDADRVKPGVFCWFVSGSLSGFYKFAPKCLVKQSGVNGVNGEGKS